MEQFRVLQNGIKMPVIGFGTYKSGDFNVTVNAVKKALEAGYRYIDTASFYGNEEAVAEGIRQSGIPRNEVFIATKVWQNEQGYDNTLKAFEQSAKKLDTDYIDLYLVHWPTVHNSDTWRALEKLYKDGYVRAIGVCNFKKHHLETLLESAEIIPMVNQIQLHPELTENVLCNYCKSMGIQVISWAPIARGRIFDIPLLKELANKYGKSIAQIVIKWHIQLGYIPIPKSSKVDRIAENYDVFDFNLETVDLNKICDLNLNLRISSVPEGTIFDCDNDFYK